MSHPSIQNYVLTDHARLEMQRRGIAEADVARVLAAPEQCEEVRPNRCVYQSKVMLGAPIKLYLLRVFVDTEYDPP